MDEQAALTQAVPCPRRFNLGDAMIVVAAMAVALVLVHGSITWLPHRAHEWFQVLGSLTGWSEWAFPTLNRTEMVQFLVSRTFTLVEPLYGVFAALTLVGLVVRLRRPRPGLGELLRQPGFIACLAIVVSSLVVADLEFLWSLEVPFWSLLVAASALAWVVLALPPWRAERGWIDRLGRVVGVFWILMVFATEVFQRW